MFIYLEKCVKQKTLSLSLGKRVDSCNNMKKLTINSIGVIPFANFLGLLGAVTGIVGGILLPVLAVLAAGNLGDVDAAIDSVSAAASADLGKVVGLGIGGWIGGAAYAWITNVALKVTKGVSFEISGK